MCICYIIPKCKACCCFDLHVGAYICCATEILYCMLDVILILTVYKYSVHSDTHYRVTESNQPEPTYDADSVPDRAKLLINCFLLIFSILLLVGIKKKNQLLVVPYLYIAFVNIIVLIGYIVVRIKDDLEGWFFMLQVFSLLYHFFIWFEIQSYYQILDRHPIAFRRPSGRVSVF